MSKEDPFSGTMLSPVLRPAKPEPDYLHDLRRRLTSTAVDRLPSNLVVHADAKLDHPIRVSPVDQAGAEQARQAQDGNPLDDMRFDEFVVGIDMDALMRGGEFYRFIGPDESIELDAYSNFLTISRAKLEEMVGHTLPVNPDNGHPLLGDDERSMVAAGLAVRAGVIDNKKLSREQKQQIMSSLRGKPLGYTIVDATMIADGGSSGMRFTYEGGGGEIEFPEKVMDALLGRSLSATKGNLTDAETEFLGTAVAAYEQLQLKAPPGGYRMNPVCNYAKTKHGEAAAKRLRRFLLGVVKERIDYHEGQVVALDLQRDAANELKDWAKSAVAGKGFVLERADGSRFHHLREALHTRSVMALSTTRKQPASLMDAFDEMSSSFVVEHDWAGAFAGAGEFDSGEFSLPYASTLWEFQVAGRRVCLAVAQSDAENIAILFLVTNVGWVIGGAYQFNRMGALSLRSYREVEDSDFVNNLAPGFNQLTERLLGNVRAMAISLEAEVAQSETVRADYKLNQARERRGKLPLYDYHVVSLVRRSRAAPLPAGALDPDREIARRRCHFRRGHWRHYEVHKTWIKWMLVGDPDLGFVDKHYRL